MAKIVELPVVTVTAKFTVTEGELRALDALAGYGDDAFIRTFYEKMGQTYLKPHELHLREFLKSIREIASPILSRADAARKAFSK
jgi:alpha-D-ribose 1-methylphosphonate 5-triphosphate synthase subunit PhnL